MTEVTENYNRSLSSYDQLESQVNNVVAGKSPNSLDLSKVFKSPWIYLGIFSILFLIILWVWSPGFLKNEENKTKWWLMLVIVGILTVISTGLVWYFFLRKKPEE